VARPSALGLGVAGIFFGLFCVFFPLICAALSSLLGFSPLHPLVKTFDAGLPGLGKYLLVISVIHMLTVNLYAIIHSRTLQASVAMKSSERLGVTLESSFIPHCWEMYSCPDAARKHCPNYQDKINCWKRTRGCLCDHMLTSFLFRNHQPETAGLFDKGATHHAVAPQELEAYPQRLRAERPRPWRERWKFCHACSIFLEHQEIKYRRFNWVFAPISLALIAVLFPVFDFCFRVFARSVDHLSARLAASGSLPEGFYGGTGILNSAYEYVLLSVLALLLMSYVVEITDRCLVDWKW
jgi:hypothetical protein